MNYQLSAAITFALIHSLWVALLTYAIVRLITLSISTPRVRYLVSVLGLATVTAITVGIFISMIPPTASASDPGLAYSHDFQIISLISPLQESARLSSVVDFFQLNSHVFATCWLLGSILFMIRLSGGIWYVHRINASAVPISGLQDISLEQLSKKLGIKTKVHLSESFKVHAPIVTGIFKPIIILPIGMASGLSTSELESVLAHEVIHIRRHDYIINLVQSVIESFLFFNPFVWLLSAHIRREREHCCDDAVVACGIDKLVYVRALASLEETRLKNHRMAISLAQNKGFLLQRIKRLMENSVRKYTPREKMLPLILLLVGLVCASWLSIQTRSNVAIAKIDHQSDTIPPARTIPRLPAPPAQGFDPMDVEVPEFPEFEDEALFGEVPFPPIPIFPDIEITIPPVPDFAFDYHVGDFANENFQVFQQEFLQKFSERFGDFYENNSEELHELMSEVQQLNLSVAELGKIDIQRLSEIEQSYSGHEEFMQKHALEMKKFEESMRDWESINRREMEALQSEMKEFERQQESFQKALLKQLRDDGYLSSDERIESIQMEDGAMRINGKPIKESDLPTYEDIRQKHFPDPKLRSPKKK